ncbi:MAG TPA: potassium transporter TrkG [Candidatus Sulfomarinibacteraceae bacterium]|nr:potassium transporter TrkG [Candidatus Sulfomarinibacteraceae bacterium]
MTPPDQDQSPARQRVVRSVSTLIHDSDDAVQKPVPVALRLVLGLLLLVVVGTLSLLLLPGVTTGPRLTLTEALFTATSALTVTGLTVVTTSTEFTRFGHLLILILVQIGGVGYLFALALALRLVGRRVGLMDRLALSGSLGLDKPKDIIRLSQRVLAGILIIEGLGALFLYLHWHNSGIVPEENAFFYAVFHAVMAFCNAGFDLFAGLARYPRGVPGDHFTLLIMGLLILLGGLGIPVLTDLALLWRRDRSRRLSLHTRLTLWAVVALVLIGWLGLFIPETRAGGVLHGDPLDQQLMHTWFQSISTRTAGFPGFADFDNLVPESQLLVIALMFIGSAPASMGGGITTGTFVVLVLALWSYARGHPHVQVAGRTIAAGTVRRAAVILTIGIGSVFFASWLILMTHDLSMNTVLFEVVSAFATVGLSLGITEELNVFGRVVIVIMMFWGRLGAVTLVAAIAQRMSQPERAVQYPEEPVLI